MTKLIPYKSQVSRTAAGQIEVLSHEKRRLISKSDLYWLLRVFVTFGLTVLVLYEMISFFPFIVILLTSLIGYVLIVIFFPTVDMSKLERIIIDEQRIMYIYQKDRHNESVFIDDDYLDLKIRVTENGTSINILNETIELQNAEDLAILMDGISEVMDLEFYDTCQLSDKTEVITYKSKKVGKVDFLTTIEIEQKNDTIYFVDTFDPILEFSIVEINQKIEIRYIEELEKGKILGKSIISDDISKITLRLEKAPLNGNYYFVVEVYIAKAKFKNRVRTIFKSSSELGELETRRSVNKTVHVLKAIPCLEYIPIEKQE